MTGLPHPLLKVSQIQMRVVGGVPDKIVPITTLDPVFPSAEEDRVHLAGKEIRERITPDGKRYRMQQIASLGTEAWRRVRIHLNFHFQHLSGCNLPHKILSGFNDQKFIAGVCLEEGRLHR